MNYEPGADIDPYESGYAFWNLQSLRMKNGALQTICLWLKNARLPQSVITTQVQDMKIQ